MYGVALTLEAIDHYLLHDHGRLGERVAVPLRGLRRELRDCLAVCVVELQGEINRRRGTDNPVVIARMGELA
jgi:hypothetical protein